MLCDKKDDDKVQDNNVSYKEIDMLPEEKISTAVKEHIVNIRQQVFEHIYNNSPSFFEHLVMDLLLKMGYGYDKIPESLQDDLMMVELME